MLILPQYVEERYATELLESATAGVGYLLKDLLASVSVGWAGTARSFINSSMKD